MGYRIKTVQVPQLVEYVDGWVLIMATDDYPVPQLIKGKVLRTPTPGLYIPADSTGWDYQYYILGETFFTHEYPAYLKLREILTKQKQAKQFQIDMIDEELSNVEAVIEEERRGPH